MTDSTQNQPWYSVKGEYTGNEPHYYSQEEFSWLNDLEGQFSLIKTELEDYLKFKNDSIEPYFNTDLVTNKNAWKLGVFYFWGERMNEDCDRIPALDNIMNSIPGFLSAGLSILDPNTTIKPHNGDTDAVIRVHLGLNIPSGLPDCGLEVGGEQRSWEEGKTIAFCDAHIHSAWNNTDKARYVLILDVLKPDLIPHQAEICENVHSIMKLQKLDAKYAILRHSPKFLRGIVRQFLK
jgi:aspartyl/asparaginyl beta-hydroxylase (cupin superfamily)